jgi:hypothetical protein
LVDSNHLEQKGLKSRSSVTRKKGVGVYVALELPACKSEIFLEVVRFGEFLQQVLSGSFLKRIEVERRYSARSVYLIEDHIDCFPIVVVNLTPQHETALEREAQVVAVVIGSEEHLKHVN